MGLLQLDIHTIINMLFFGNLVTMAVLLIPFSDIREQKSYRFFTAGKVLQAAAWFLLSQRGQIDDIFSVFVGNSLLFSGFAAEALTMVIANNNQRRWELIYSAITAISILFFCMFGSNPSVRIATASLLTILIFMTAFLAVVFAAKATRLRKIIAFLYIPLCISLSFRIWLALFGDTEFSLMTSNMVQSFTFLSMYLLMFTSCIGFFLLAKEDNDKLLKDSEEKYRVLVEQANEAIIVIHEGKFLFCNEKIGEWLGVPFKSLIGTEFIDFVAPSDKAMVAGRHFRRIQGDDMPENYDFRIYDINKREIWVSVSAKVVQWESKPAVLALLTNIDNRKLAEEELLETNRHLLEATTFANDMAAQAELANGAKSEFLANMSHEIRTPLNGVIGFTELLKSTQLNSVQANYVENAQISAQSLLTVVNDILDFSKIEAGRMELEFITTDLIDLCQRTLDVVRFSADAKNLRLIFDHAPDLPRFAKIDPVRLKQILVNLLGNAVKFTQKGEVKLRVSVNFTADDKSSGELQISIRDTGIGISAEQQKKLFQPFSQADSSTTRKFGGTGLGLVISVMLIEKMGSKIVLNSQVGVGSEFSFTLKTSFEEDLPTVQPAVSNSVIVSDLRAPRILVAEDLKMNMLLVITMIKNELPNATILEAENGETALRLAKESSPDLIFMDIQMPGMDGLTATEQIRKYEQISGEQSAIIALTAGVLQEERDKCLAAGMDDFLSKPIVRTELSAVLKKWLVKKNSTKSSAGLSAAGASASIKELSLYGVDLVEGLNRFCGNQKLYTEMLMDFAKDYCSAPKILDELIVAENFSVASDKIHAIKGLSGNLSINAIFKLSAEINSSLKHNQVAQLPQLLVKFTEEMEKVCTSILSGLKSN